MKLKLFTLSSSLIAVLLFSGCKNNYLLKGLGDTYLKFRSTPGITGYTIFHNRVVNVGTPQPWPVAKKYGKEEVPHAYGKYLRKNKTVGYLIIKNDSIRWAGYFPGYCDTSHINAFSMGKSIVSLLVGAAIKEGKIKSVDEKVSDFIPSYNKGVDSLLTIKDLLTMSSGIHFGESEYNPFGYPAKMFYGNNLLSLTLKYHCKDKPGTIFTYQSGNTVLLGDVVTKATGETITEYTSEKLWKPLGAERPAFFSLDHEGGMEKAFYSNEFDFARIGMLMLDSGKWKGKEIIPKDYFMASTMGQTVSYYGYQWWVDTVGKHRVIYAWGFLGQYIFIIPDENMVVVRLGKEMDDDDLNMYVGLAILMYGG